MKTYTNVFDLGDLKTALAEAFEIKNDRYKYESLGKHKTCLLIFFNNSLRTRLSTQKAARNLGMDVIVLDVNQGAWKLETGKAGGEGREGKRKGGKEGGRFAQNI